MAQGLELDCSDDSLGSDFFKEFEDEDFDCVLGDNLSGSESFNTCSTAKQVKVREKRVQPSLATCSSCNKRFFSKDGYKTHLKRHIFHELLLHGLDKESCIFVCREECGEVLTEVKSGATSYGKGPEIQELATALSAPNPTLDIEAFFGLVGEKIWECIPAPALSSINQFHSSFVQNVVVLQSGDKYEAIYRSLQNALDFHKPVLDCFLCIFLTRLSVRFEAAYLKSVKAFREVRREPSKCRDNEEDIDFQQSVHYVGGAAIKSVLSAAFQATSSVKWENISRAIREKLLVGDLVVAPEEEVSSWTRSRNRGGLKFIGEGLMSFFMALTVSEVLKKVECAGGVLHEDVQKELEDSILISCLWSELIGDSLSENDSSFLQSPLVKRFTNTWGHGVILRRQNASASGGDFVSLRDGLSRNR